MLRPFLNLVHDDPQAAALARDGGRAFVASSLRAYVVAALADEVFAASKPALVVAGDDRQARDLAHDLEAWLAPRPVRFYPSRGVAYESHLAPPPHLVGLRVAAIDALLSPDGEPPVVVVSAAALSEKVPDPALRPASFVLRKGDLLDLDETASQLVAAGYERIDQVEDRGQFAIRGGILDVFPATADHAVRVDLFDIEIESLREFSTFTQRSLAELDEVLVAPAAELSAEHRELAEIAAISAEDENRPDVAELLPLDRFRAFLDLAPADAAVIVAADEDIEPALHDHWADVCAAFHDSDAHGLYVTPEAIESALDERARVRLGTISGDQPFAFRAQASDFAARSLKEAEPELEKLVRSSYRTLVTWARRGDGERVAYNLARLRAQWVEGEGVPAPELRFAVARLRDGFVAPGFNLAVIPETRLFRRRRAEPTDEDGGRRRRGALRAFAGLRTGDIVVHEAPGVARVAGVVRRRAPGRHRRPRGPGDSPVRGVRHEDRRGRDARLSRSRVRGHRPGLHAGRPAREDLALRRGGRGAPAPVEARRDAL